ncbi:type I-E CRISPR-associated protein Cse2/CasB [Streptomyces sp. NPDC058045]|uniref:type I-E CRISPR-associated protein Cse2/CasB n=1 Tax=Streptomyces sp. NPDC058045 TaxID=3346311 RepID=UPI0036EACED7
MGLFGLRREAVPLDYGLLAEQLHTWQRPGGPQSVRCSWGRSYLARRPASGDSPAEASPDKPGGGDSRQDPDPTTPEDDTP